MLTLNPVPRKLLKNLDSVLFQELNEGEPEEVAKKAAKHYGIEITEKTWQDIGNKPHTKNKAGAKAPAKK
jgi:hypothetical protein